MNKYITSMMKYIIIKLEGDKMKMKHSPDEPLYDTDKCSECGGEIVKVREGKNPVFACCECGKRA